MTEADDDLPAGDFSSWADEVTAALRGERGSDVPCGTCLGCCTSSQFVHIGPDETETLARIPRALRFPAPGLPRGHVLLGYDQRGRCPMLVDDRCSIYEHRPRTCRVYDCRVFPATGLDPAEGDGDKERIAARTRRWRFSHPSEADRIRHEAARAAARFLRDRAGELPEGVAPRTTTECAVMAVAIHALFVGSAEPDPATVGAEILRRRR